MTRVSFSQAYHGWHCTEWERYQNNVIDVLEDFEAALESNVLITPALILVSPPPKVTIFGNLSDTKKVLAALRLPGGE